MGLNTARKSSTHTSYVNIIILYLIFFWRYEWYTSGRKDLNNGYVWEGEGVKLSDVSPVLNFWMSGYQFVPQERLIYKFDATRKFLNKIFKIKLRMVMGNMSKKQQLDQSADNSRKPPMGLQCSEKLPHPETCFSWPLKKMYVC